MFPGKTKILFSQATFISTSNQFCFKVIDQRDPTLWITLIRRWRWSKIRHWIFNIAKRWYKFNVVSSWPQHKVTFIKALQNKVLINNTAQKQLSRGVLSKRCSENMRQIYRITPMPKCDFNKVACNFIRNGIPENRDPGPYKNRKTGTLRKTGNRDPKKPGNYL